MLVETEKWEEAYELLSEKLDIGELDKDAYVSGAKIFEHFGQMDIMFDTICCGLKMFPRSYELYDVLGDYYSSINPDQAFLSYENALYFAEKEGNVSVEKKDMLKLKIRDYANSHTLSVKNVSFIILSYNNLDYTKLCIQSIRNNCRRGYEIVVVDNASEDGSVEWLREQTDIVLAENKENVGFPAGCNQGIRMADTNNDIFLLNNDTIMLTNSLYQLRMGLYASKRHGAAGAVTNYAGNNQIAYSEGDVLEDYYKYAYTNNLPGDSPYEQKSMLIMFAMLIKREVYEIVGELDERFTPGNYEDNDYGIRILAAGFQNVLCWNSFIFHYGSRSFHKDVNTYVNLHTINRGKFIDKWGFAPEYYLYARKEIANLIDASDDAAINVLEVGCGLGDTLAFIKHKFSNADVHGIELVEQIASLGRAKFDIKCGNIDSFEFKAGEKYDYIIFADVLEHLIDPCAVISRVKDCLKENGCILTSIPNIMNAHVIYELLHGNFTYQEAGILDRTHLRFFTQKEIYHMFEKEGYEIDQFLWKVDKKESTHLNPEFFERILDLVGEDKKILFDTYQFLVRARIKTAS